jgi:hypothetical protein
MPPKKQKAGQNAIDVAKGAYKKVFGKPPQGKLANDPAWIYGEIHDRTKFEAARAAAVLEAAQAAQPQITQQQVDVNVNIDLRKDSDGPSDEAQKATEELDLSSTDLSSTDSKRRFDLLEKLLLTAPHDLKHIAAELSEITQRQFQAGRSAGGLGKHLKSLENQKEGIASAKAKAQAAYNETKRTNPLIKILIECVQDNNLLPQAGFVENLLEAATAVAGRADFLIRDKAVTTEIEAARKKKEEQQAISSAAKYEYETKMAGFQQKLKDNHTGRSNTPRPRRGMQRSTTISSQEFEIQAEEQDKIEEADASAKIAELSRPTALMYIGVLDQKEYGPVQVSDMSKYIKQGCFGMDVRMRSTASIEWYTARHFFTPEGNLVNGIAEQRDFTAQPAKRRKTLSDMGRQNAMPNASHGGIVGMMGASGAADSASNDFLDSF